METNKPGIPTQDEDGVHEARREFLKQSSLLTALALTPPTLMQAAEPSSTTNAVSPMDAIPLSIDINNKAYTLSVDPRVTLLDLLREQLHLTGTKKGCDYGQCGACTVHVNGQRVLACLSFAAMHRNGKVTTIEGLADGDPAGRLHPMQEAFIKHDGFQCGYCTPGQIMSAVACIREGHANSEAEIREYMSGNVCRCGAYTNIFSAIQDVKQGGQKA